ncbi:tryparedoxin-like [Lineus longissimus]|uniref:tryparedoxin-like n=1 Tax=Lineus longissimus TaxID=88925 RepID=UPI002B4C6429
MTKCSFVFLLSRFKSCFKHSSRPEPEFVGEMQGLLGDHVIDHATEQIPIETVCGEGKVLGLYVSASWCGPCRKFTPQLVAFYNRMRAKVGSNFQVIFISRDKTEDEFRDYFAAMPWLAMPYNKEKADVIKTKLEIKSIPSFILFDSESGKIIQKNGRNCIVADPDGHDYPWNQ